MAKKRRAEPLILQMLEAEFERARKKTVPPFPYDPKTQAIKLPDEIVLELRTLVRQGNNVLAVKRVTQLTGAGLRLSKDFVDGLVRG
ncbi:MAG: hypothetical protein HY868_02005 [Chloroflexi bacterium]|nr:hypothetical protein [Chloroflexota bacterium]